MEAPASSRGRRALSLLRVVLLGQPAKTRRGRIARGASLVLLVGYLTLVAHPTPLFAHEVAGPRFALRSDEPLPDGPTRVVLARAEALLDRSPITDEGTHQAVVCNAPWRLRLLSPFSTEAFGLTRRLCAWIVINRADIAADRCFVGERVRTLSGVLAHEATHELLHRRLPLLQVPPTWKVEGLCDFVARESSLDDATGWRVLREGSSSPAWESSGFLYWRARRMVIQLLEVEGWTVDELFAREVDEAALLERLRAQPR